MRLSVRLFFTGSWDSLTNEVFVSVVQVRDGCTAPLMDSSWPCHPGDIAKDRVHPLIAWYLAIYPCGVTYRMDLTILHSRLRSTLTAMIFDANRDQKRSRIRPGQSLMT